ncbi:aminotransferase class I/II-fold pyridoxal phosphate-dependent enzyme [Streptomyces sp. NPDC051582]|uniref:MalY/PatB family protein n=1 Tax=Streptomyces sp. NPDC051582 TaxID=3155167 RepID=UPI00341ABB0A
MNADTSSAALDSLDLSRLSQRDGEKWATAGDGMLASWVADMDFPIAPAIRRALLRRADGDLGYPPWFDESRGGPLGEVFAERTLHRYGHRPDPTHVRLFTDINQAMLATLQVATDPGDAVLLHTPACPPFVDVIEKIGRRALTVPIQEGEDGWQFDPALMERTAADEGAGRCRVLFLVNPHNPTGRVFRRDELESLAELVLRFNLLVISDEVHADLTHAPHQHTPFASLSPEIAARTVTLTSGSKAFNLAGIRCALAHIGPQAVRDGVDARRGLLFGQVGVLAVEALKAAWTSGDAWLDEVLAVLDRNRRLLTERLPEGIRCRTPEATFLAWLDCRQLDIGQDPMPFFRDEAKVLLFSGPAFGAGGDGFVRLNFGTSQQVLEETLERMSAALRRRGRVGEPR